MTRETERENMSDRPVDGQMSDRDRARRRLLKAGSIAAPMVLTLRSGTAWAASLTCYAKQPVPPHYHKKKVKKAIKKSDINHNNVYDIDEKYSKNNKSGRRQWLNYHSNQVIYSHELNPHSESHQRYVNYVAHSCWASLKDDSYTT